MKRRRNLNSGRKSISHFPSMERHLTNDPWSGLYSHMFIEDVSHAVMPIGGKSRKNPEFKITLDPSVADNEDILRLAFPSNGYSRYTITEAVSQFITDCATLLVYKGIAQYEIIYENPKGIPERDLYRRGKLPLEKLRIFRPISIPGKVIKILGYYLQMIPLVDWTSQKRPFVVIPDRNVWIVELPTQLGNQASQTRLLKQLMKYNVSVPSFVTFDFNDRASFKDFDFSEFHKYSDLRIAMETSPWNWTARSLLNKRLLEYYLVYRHLRFACAMAVLREHILLSINKLLLRIDFPGQLSVKGLPTSNDLQEMLVKLELGTISFSDVSNKISVL